MCVYGQGESGGRKPRLILYPLLTQVHTVFKWVIYFGGVTGLTALSALLSVVNSSEYIINLSFRSPKTHDLNFLNQFT